MMQPAPGTFDVFKVLVVQDEIDLFGKFTIDLGDHTLHGAEHVILLSFHESPV